jgi:hypothetical protein
MEDDSFSLLAGNRVVTVCRRNPDELVFDAEFDKPLREGPEGFTVSISGVGPGYDRTSLEEVVRDTALGLLREYGSDGLDPEA